MTITSKPKYPAVVVKVEGDENHDPYALCELANEAPKEAGVSREERSEFRRQLIERLEKEALLERSSTNGFLWSELRPSRLTEGAPVTPGLFQQQPKIASRFEHAQNPHAY